MNYHPVDTDTLYGRAQRQAIGGKSALYPAILKSFSMPQNRHRPRDGMCLSQKGPAKEVCGGALARAEGHAMKLSAKVERVKGLGTHMVSRRLSRQSQTDLQSDH